MSLTITKGYLINVIKYDVFDLIITFINEYGNKFTCIALGARKIISKNGRSLLLGNYNEFEFFLARNKDKISKLKRSVCIDAIDWKKHSSSFYLLNELVNKIEPGIKLFEFYKNNLFLIKNELKNDKLIILIILKEFCQLSGINIYTQKCVICGNRKIKTISFKEKGLLCQFCAKDKEYYELNFSKLIFNLFNNNFDEISNQEKHFDYAIKLLKKYIHDNLGINIKTLNDY